MQRKQVAFAMFAGVSILCSTSATALAQDATPTITYTCDNLAAQTAGTPDATMGDMPGTMGTPMAGMDHTAMDMEIARCTST